MGKKAPLSQEVVHKGKQGAVRCQVSLQAGSLLKHWCRLFPCAKNHCWPVVVFILSASPEAEGDPWKGKVESVIVTSPSSHPALKGKHSLCLPAKFPPFPGLAALATQTTTTRKRPRVWTMTTVLWRMEGFYGSSWRDTLFLLEFLLHLPFFEKRGIFKEHQCSHSSFSYTDKNAPKPFFQLPKGADPPSTRLNSRAILSSTVWSLILDGGSRQGCWSVSLTPQTEEMILSSPQMWSPGE